MFRILQNFSLIIALLFVTSCSTPNWWKPRGYLMFRKMPKGGTPGYNLGWIHGCQSGLGSQFGGEFMQFFYSWSRDPDITSSKPNIALIKNRYKKELKDINWNDPADIKLNFEDYNLTFWNAHFFCRQTILGSLQMGGLEMSPLLPGEHRHELGKHSVGNIWKLNGKGDARYGSTGPGGGYW